MAGSSTPGSRITACQFGAFSHAYSSVRVTPWRRTVSGRFSARGIARSSTGSNAGVGARAGVSTSVSSLFGRGGIGNGREGKGRAVHAVALAGRLRSVGKHVAEMRIAGRAAHLGASHQEGTVVVLVDHIRREGGEEARP